jgi:hypothetical protein
VVQRTKTCRRRTKQQQKQAELASKMLAAAASWSGGDGRQGGVCNGAGFVWTEHGSAVLEGTMPTEVCTVPTALARSSSLVGRFSAYMERGKEAQTAGSN